MSPSVDSVAEEEAVSSPEEVTVTPGVNELAGDLVGSASENQGVSFPGPSVLVGVSWSLNETVFSEVEVGDESVFISEFPLLFWVVDSLVEVVFA